ncbi:hypothetical protein GA0111570_10298 [Raineyella antarctica]|uniref:Uncharacterized protein n=1 Tax=Raineyella antarctica TaxID=1577474 RepID=A0A1G6GEB1_9ACTN|nr:hypothetical protein [Raineyella antarctica]SDB80310.1 hypothetical protein GA0111570_10298 [Raineyella antarctica]
MSAFVHLPALAAPVLAVTLLLAGCASGPAEVSVDGPAPGLVAPARCIGPAVAGTTPLPGDVTQVSSTGHLEVCLVGYGDASLPDDPTRLVSALEFTVQNPGIDAVRLPADVPLLQAAPYGPAAVLAPKGRVLPEMLEGRSAVTARVLYDYTADQRSGAQVHWADLVFELAG